MNGIGDNVGSFKRIPTDDSGAGGALFHRQMEMKPEQEEIEGQDAQDGGVNEPSNEGFKERRSIDKRRETPPNSPPKNEANYPYPIKTKSEDEESFCSSAKVEDSPATKYKKRAWTVGKLQEEIFARFGVNIFMDETLIQSWFNQIFRMIDEDYVPHLSYATPNENTYQDITLSPNGKFFKVFDDLDHSTLETRKKTSSLVYVS
ncbi:unnamed protein product [Lactuca saligna]|uniref:Uncharacterized protein n=1 Tax=Lactuca saligna TaxID=75948 RepID=A0AA35Y438_LACSI|nr:unnamed protein product [Lactuca saligna]